MTQRTRAEEALRGSREEIRRLSRQMLVSQEAERGRLALELHDGLGQSLAAIKYFVESAIRKSAGDAEAIAALQPIVPKIQDAVGDVRRLSMALRPITLDALGLLPTLGSLCREFQEAYPGVRLEARVEVGENDTPDGLKIVVCRIVQEALSNVGRHSGAGRVRLALTKIDETLELLVEDDGAGFDVETYRETAPLTRGFGLDNARERAELSDGELIVESEQGSGTRIRALWHLPSAAPAPRGPGRILAGDPTVRGEPAGTRRPQTPR